MLHRRRARTRLGILGVTAGLAITSVVTPIWSVGQVAAAPAAKAEASTVTITSLPDQTFMENEGAGGVAEIVADDHAQDGGSLHLTTGDDDSGHPQVTLNDPSVGTPVALSDVTTAKYDVLTAAGDAATYQLPTWCDGTVSADNNAHFVTFVAEAPAASTSWQTVDAAAAQWWPTKYVLNDGTTASTAPEDGSTIALNKDQDYDLATIQEKCAEGTTTGPKLNLGSGAANADDYVDNVVLNDTTWNFQKGAVTVTVTAPDLSAPTHVDEAHAAPFTAHITNTGPELDGTTVNFAFAPYVDDDTVRAANFTVEYQQSETSWVPVALVDGSGEQEGQIVGSFGATDLTFGFDETSNLRVYLDPSVHGVPMAIATTVEDSGGNALASTLTNVTPVSGPANDCPATLGTGATVRLAYGRYLGRCPDEHGYATQKGFLDNGGKVVQMTYGFAHSRENLASYVNDIYLAMLGRAVDGSGIVSQTNYIASNHRVDDLLANLANSNEFALDFQTNPEKVEILYSAILGRDADANGLVNFSNALSAGVKPGALAKALWRSQENLTNLVNHAYGKVLLRAADVSGIHTWSAVLVFTGNPFYLEGALGGSLEFSNAAQAFAPINPPAES